MNIKFIVASVLLVASFNVFASDNTANNTANSSASTQSSSAASNGGLQNQQNFITNNPGDIKYSGGYTVNNVPTVAMGSFSNSFSSDYCSGTMQATIGIAGAGVGVGKQKLDQGCQLLRAADMTMRIAQVFAADADASWKFSNTLGPAASAQAYAIKVREASYKKAGKADALKDAAVNMVCAISDEVRKAMTDAAVDCPKK